MYQWHCTFIFHPGKNNFTAHFDGFVGVGFIYPTFHCYLIYLIQDVKKQPGLSKMVLHKILVARARPVVHK